MHAQAALILAAAGFAVAQTTSATAATSSAVSQSGCGSQIDAIISSCLGTEQGQLNACASTDWDCLCTQTTNVLTCYNNCPGDPDRNSVLQQQTAWCNAAKVYSSSSSSAAVVTLTASSSASAAVTVTKADVATASASTVSASGAAASLSASEGRAVNSVSIVGSSGVVAAVLGFAALL